MNNVNVNSYRIALIMGTVLMEGVFVGKGIGEIDVKD